ncbi:CpsD/CapB family tyrosine-protein kinase [Carnobacteriaceae bacterium 52-44]
MAFKNEREAESSGMIVADNPFSIVSEQFRTIRTNIQFSMIDKQLQTLSITSATPSSGKTIIASNLAGAFAAEDTKVLLVDADMRKPSIHKIFGVKNLQGLTSILTDRNLRLSDVTRRSYVDNLDFITCGLIPPNPSELMGSKRMTELIDQMKENYDLVIFDNPPLLAVTDAQIMATKVDGTIVVVPKGEVTKDELDKAADLLDNVQANVLGTVLNKVEVDADTYYYYGAE